MALVFHGDTVNLGAGADLIIRPSAGELWFLKCIAGQNSVLIQCIITDGTFSSHVCDGASTTAVSIAALDIPLDNTEYARLHNSSGGAIDAGYRAVEL